MDKETSFVKKNYNHLNKIIFSYTKHMFYVR